MACSDLCTAAKCQELEERIGALEQALELLEAAFEAHLTQAIPEAHDYTPIEPEPSNLSISASFQSETLTISVADGQSQDTAQVQIPFPELPEPEPAPEPSNLSISASFQSETLTISVADGESQDTAQVQIPFPEIPEPEPPIEPEPSNLSISASFQSETLTISVADGESQDTAQVQIPFPEIPEPEPAPEPSNLRIDGIYQSETLTITIADGESSDTASIFIPQGNEIINNILITEEIVNCDNLSQEFQDCCSQILSAINNLQSIITAELDDRTQQLTNEIDNARNLLGNDILTVDTKVDNIEDYVTIDIGGTVKTNYQCKFAEDEGENVIPTYAQAEVTNVNLSTQNLKGLRGIEEYLKIISTNLESVYIDVCKAIDPILKITLDDLYRYCNNSGIERTDYPDTPEGEEQYLNAIQQYFADLLANSKYGYLVDNATPDNGNTLIAAPSNWITPMVADLALIQGRINNAAICDIKSSEPPDVVSIVASEKDLHRVKDKVLILHLVLLDVYPKRRGTDSLWQMQIPAAKDHYDWLTDFEPLRRKHGNQYAELRFQENYVPVSGWFEDETTANAFFDAVLALTNATEDNRVISKHTMPKTAIPVFETRPYRAFIKSINAQGIAICHAKYVPVIPDESTTN
ncbi:MAG: hypothetical protein QNJ72_25740 [Pleurocapsa sp. MO_226.B13]|nr:hypothetical protein [Pleurocapsa sp. MO_226.B13]